MKLEIDNFFISVHDDSGNKIEILHHDALELCKLLLSAYQEIEEEVDEELLEENIF